VAFDIHLINYIKLEYNASAFHTFERRIFVMRCIDFLCVGAEKSGTTWIAEMLRQHPQIFIPFQKELHYFNRKFVEDPSLENYHFYKPLEWYLSFFAPARPEQVKGEVCPSYLWDDSAPRRIYEVTSDVKIFMILRDPVERTFSTYRYYIQKGIIRPGKLPDILVKYKNLLLDRSAYFSQVKRYFDLFPREQLKVYFFDDLRRDPASLLREIEHFLQVEEFLPPNVADAIYVTGEPASAEFNRLLARLRHWARRNLPPKVIDWSRRVGIAQGVEMLRKLNRSRTRPSFKEAVSEDVRKWLQEYFRKDVEQLEELLGVDLSAWKK
jgi:hypothetical protein